MPGVRWQRFRNHTPCGILGLPDNCAVWSDGSTNLGPGGTARDHFMEIASGRHFRGRNQESTMNESKQADMTPEEFRQWGHQFVDWAANYLAHPEQLNVLSQVEPGSIRNQLPVSP